MGGVVVVMNVALCTEWVSSQGFNFCCLLVEQASLKFPDSFTGVVTTPGASVHIPIEVTGTPTPSITLQKMEDGSWINIQGKRFKVNTTVISISSVKSSDAGEYQLVLSNRPDQSTTYQFSILVESE